MENEKKYIKKLCPVPIYDFEAVECWLMEMAQKGYILKKATLNKMFFEKKDPQKVVYYLESAKKGILNPVKEDVEYFNSKGLMYLCTIKDQLNNQKGYCHIYCGNEHNCNDDYRVEGYDDRISEQIFNEIQTQEFFLALGPLILFGSAIYTSKEPILYWLVKSDMACLALLISIISISRLLLCILNSIDFKKNIRRIKDGKRPCLHTYSKLKKGIKILKYLLFIFIIIAISNCFYSIKNNEETILSKKSILSPTQYLIKDIYISGENGENDIFVDTIECYELASKLLVNPFINTLLNNKEDSILEIEEFGNSKKLICMEYIGEKEKRIIVQNNKSILYVKYEDEGVSNQHIEKVMKRLKVESLLYLE